MFSLFIGTCARHTSEVSGHLSHEAGCSVIGSGRTERGVFGSWGWDGSDFQLVTDAFGYLPYYYHYDPVSHDLLVSDSPQMIAAKLSEVRFDSLALGFFSRTGFMIGDRTIYEQVKRVPAESVLRWSSSGLEIKSSPITSSHDHPGTPEEAVDGFIDRFQEAMRLRSSISGELVMPLSSGRDSRMMLLSLIDLGVNPRELITIGGHQNADVRIASSLSTSLGIPFRHITGSDGSWLHLEEERHRRCGYEALEHVWLLPLWLELLSGSPTWFDGLGCGSVLRNDVNHPHALGLLRERRYRDWCRSFFSCTAAPSEPWVERIRERSPISIAPEDEVIDLIGVELEKYRDQPNPITSFTFHNWGRRSISLNPLGICRANRSIGLPFMDRDLVNWSLSIPAEWCFERDIQTEACHRLFPKFRELPFAIEGSTNRNRTSLIAKLRNRRQKRRFFADQGRCFRSLYRGTFPVGGRDPDYSRAEALMAHLALADKAHIRVHDEISPLNDAGRPGVQPPLIP